MTGAGLFVVQLGAGATLTGGDDVFAVRRACADETSEQVLGLLVAGRPATQRAGGQVLGVRQVGDLGTAQHRHDHEAVLDRGELAVGVHVVHGGAVLGARAQHETFGAGGERNGVERLERLGACDLVAVGGVEQNALEAAVDHRDGEHQRAVAERDGTLHAQVDVLGAVVAQVADLEPRALERPRHHPAFVGADRAVAGADLVGLLGR